jgi:uncharacterized membrane protein YoaK (UPF0700 family)
MAATAQTATVGARVPSAERAGVRDLLLVGLTLAAGSVDAISFLGLGKVFSAFMTGNIAFLGFRVGGAPGPPVSRVLASLAAFGAGAALAARIVRRPVQSTGVWPRNVSFALATTAACEAAFFVFWLAVDGHPGSGSEDALIALSGLAMGVQTATIFSLSVRGVFTTAATATFAVLMGDLAGWSQPGGERWRLGATLGALFAGAAIGAVLIVHARSWAPALPLVVTGAVLASAAL